MKLMVFIAMVVLVGLLVWRYEGRKTPTPQHTYTLMHLPAEGCPQNTELLPGVFIQKDGSKQDGCYRRGPTDYTIDVLNPGESVELPVFLDSGDANPLD